jgi:outer membrane immunogenic protein
MRRIAVALLAATSLLGFASFAEAADLAVRKAPPRPLPPPVPIFSWTGCYIGGHIGGLWASKDFHFRDPLVDVEFHEHHGEHDASGFLAGIQGGCDYQFGGPGGGFVIGIAADWAWADADGEHHHPFRWWADEDHRFRSEIDSVASVTARLGWAWDRFLIYGKVGVAWERDEFHVRCVSCLDGDFNEWHASDTRSGLTLGIGGEYAFTNWISAFIEANWYSFDDEDIRFDHRLLCGGCDPEHHVWKIEEEKFVIKGGINFRFGGWAAAPAVAARY